MRERVHGRSVVAAIAVAVFGVSCASAPAPRARPLGDTQGRRTPVEVYRGGDDGLTVRFCDAVEVAVKGSVVFSAVTVHTPEAMRLTIETNLRPLESGDDPKSSYVTILETADGAPIGAFRGNCRPSEFRRCATRVVEKAEEAFLRRQESRFR